VGAFDGIGERALLLGRKRSGGPDFGGHFAAAVSQNFLEGADHRGQREEAAVLGEEAQELRGQIAEAGTLGNGGDRLALVATGYHRRIDQAAEIDRVSGHLGKAAEVGGDRVELVLAVGELKQSCRVTLR
jgi:hypothetical protein